LKSCKWLVVSCLFKFMSNLEPIDEKDLNLAEKFKGGVVEKEGAEDIPIQTEKEKPAEKTAAEKEDSYAKILARVKQPAAGAVPADEEVKEDAGKVYQKTDADSQIQHLVDIAMAKGVVHAVKVARHMEDNYVLDMFHDKLLADELHDALFKKGLIREI